MSGEDRRYLGDGLYAILNDGMIELRANDLDSPTDTVFLDPSVFRSLAEFAEAHGFGGAS